MKPTKKAPTRTTAEVVGEPATGRECRLQVVEQCCRQLRVLCTEIVEETSQYRTLNSLTTQIVHDYSSRFLLELLQNADDAHSRNVVIALASEASSVPTLYIGNDGVPFSRRDFGSLSALAVSNKDPNEDIGNKGLGFRSVLEVSRNPAIFSANSVSPVENGFCFTLTDDVRTLVLEFLQAARQGESEATRVIRKWLGDEATLFAPADAIWPRLVNRVRSGRGLPAEVAENVQTYMFPLPATSDDHVRVLRAKGLRTVVRLPLNQEDALAKAQRLLSDLKASTLLFLRHIRQIEVRCDGDVVRPRVLKRENTRSGRREGDLKRAIVSETSAGDLPSTREFVTFQRVVRGAELSIAIKELPPAWRQLRLARVTLALPVGGDYDAEPGRFSVALPTEVRTGAWLWIDAPFYTHISRNEIKFDKALNRLLLDAAASSVPEFAGLLKRPGGVMGSAAALQAVEVLEPGSELGRRLLSGAIREQLSAIQLVRTAKGRAGREWASLPAIRRGPTSDGKLLTSARFAALLPLPHPDLARWGWSEERVGKLAAQFGGGLPPTGHEVGEAAEVVAREVVRGGEERARRFRDLFEDLALMLPGGARDYLKGRRLLPDSNLVLQKVGADRPVMYEAPRRGRDGADLVKLVATLPSRVAQRIQFLRVEAIRLEDGDAAVFVRQQKLVHRFNRAEIVNRALAAVSRDKRLNNVQRKEILQWAYHLWFVTRQSIETQEQPVQWREIHVPTSDGWRKADGVYFGRGWPVGKGELLEQALPSPTYRFLVRPEKFLSEMGDPPARESRVSPIEAWASFLKEAMGVRTEPASWSVPSESSRATNRFGGWNYRLHPENGLVNHARFPSDTWKAFLANLSETRVAGLVSGSKMFVLEEVFRLDGVLDVTIERTAALAQLLCSNWSDYRGLLHASVRRDDGSSARTPVTSPLAVHLRQAAWLPAVTGTGGPISLVSASDLIWVPIEKLGAEGSLPGPLDLLPHLPRAVAASEGVSGFASDVGIKKLQDLALPDTCRWLAWFEEKFATGIPAEHAKAYRGLWNDLIEQASRQYATLPAGSALTALGWGRILVERADAQGRSTVSLWHPQAGASEGAGIVYIADDRAMSSQLHGKVAILVGPTSGDSCALHERLLGARFGAQAVRRVSTLELDPLTNGAAISDASLRDAPSLREEAPWLLKATLAVLAFGRTEHMATDGERFKSALRRLSTLRVMLVDGLAVSVVGEQDVALPSEAFVWSERNVLMVDRHRGDRLVELVVALETHLDVRDLVGPVAKRLSDFLFCGIAAPPDAALLDATLVNRVLSQEQLSQVNAALDLDEYSPLVRCLPLLLATATSRSASGDKALAVYRSEWNPKESKGSLIALWRRLNRRDALPSGLEDLIGRAMAGTPESDIARSAWANLKVTLETYNAARRLANPEAILLYNPDTQSAVERIRERLLPAARALLRSHLVATGEQTTYRRRRERLEGLIPIRGALFSTWTPSFRDLVATVAMLLADPGDDELPPWTRALLPRGREDLDTLVTRVETEVHPRYDEDGVHVKNAEAARGGLDELQLLGLARWNREKTGSPPDALWREDQLLPSLWRYADLDSLLDFDWHSYKALHSWLAHWWRAMSLHMFVDVGDEASPVRLRKDWSIDANAYKAAKKWRQDLRDGSLAERRSTLILSKAYSVPGDDRFAGLSTLLDDNLDPDLGSDLDPSTPTKLNEAPKPPGPPKGGGSNKTVPGDRDSQNTLVGGIGEYIVLRALKKASSGRITNAAWKSGMRARFLDDGVKGDDELGFDFSFTLNGKRYEVEVKTTKAKTTGSLQLGPSESAAAERRAAEGNDVTWQLWLVTGALEAPRIHVLGNPYATGERGSFTLLPMGSRVLFELP